jgi:hypothetical protein
MKKFKGCLGVFGIFIFGVIFGIFVETGAVREKIQGIIEGGPDKVVDVVVNRLKDDLHLDQNQQEMLHQIAVETRIELGAIRQQTQPQVAKTLDDATQKVRGILNPGQVKKFDEIVGKARAEWKTEQLPAAPEPKGGEGPSSPPAEKAKDATP